MAEIIIFREGTTVATFEQRPDGTWAAWPFDATEAERRAVPPLFEANTPEELIAIFRQYGD